MSQRHPGVYWTIDDSGPALLYAVDGGGKLLGTVRIEGGIGSDREGLALGPCGPVDCLYVADVGDNAEVRDPVAIYRFREPDPGDERVGPADMFRLRYPGGPRDVEAVFLLPGERLYLVSKGRSEPPTLYRYPGPLRSDATVTMELLQRLADGPALLPRQVTDAAASSDGQVVALRTYETLRLLRVAGDTLAPIRGSTVDLRTLREPQGEGLGMGPDGVIVLTSEAGPLGGRGSIALLGCEPGW